MATLRENPTATLKNAHRGQIHTLGFNSTGSYVLSGGQDRAIRLWNSASRALIQTYRMVSPSRVVSIGHL